MTDAGFDEINWRKANPENVALVVGEYEKRLAASKDLYLTLDGKARWLLAVMIPLGSALLAYVFVQSSPDICTGVASAALACLVFGSAIIGGIVLRTRAYRVGAPLPDNSIAEWKPLICGGHEESLLFAKVRLQTMAEALDINDGANDTKARWLKRAIMVGCLAAPVAGFIFVACYIFLFFAVPSAVCPAVIGL